MRQVEICLADQLNAGQEGPFRTVSTAEELATVFEEFVALASTGGAEYRFFRYYFLEDGERVGAGSYSQAEGWLAGKPLTYITRL